MLQSQDNPWMKRTKWLTQALIISGTLNIGFLATFVYFVCKEKQLALSIESKPVSKEKIPSVTNKDLLHAYSLLPYQELLLRLENNEHIEDGLTKRDLALGCLVAFHHFNVDKALGGLTLQKRRLPFTNTDGQETIEIPVFPGLADYQFQAICHYAKTEKWPLTSQGLFYEIKRAQGLKDSSLLQAFYLSPEFHAVDTLLTKSGLFLSKEQVIDLIAEGEWTILADLYAEQRISLDCSVDRRRSLLVSYLHCRSVFAAKLLLENELDFICKRLDDTEVLTVLNLYEGAPDLLKDFAKDLLASPRTDAVRVRAAALLYMFAGENVPDPCDPQVAMQRFLPSPAEPLVVQTKAAFHAPSPSPSAEPKKKTHKIEPGDNLWKIARKYNVSVDELMRANRMDSEKLRPGKQLEIPEKVR